MRSVTIKVSAELENLFSAFQLPWVLNCKTHLQFLEALFSKFSLCLFVCLFVLFPSF